MLPHSLGMVPNYAGAPREAGWVLFFPSTISTPIGRSGGAPGKLREAKAWVTILDDDDDVYYPRGRRPREDE